MKFNNYFLNAFFLHQKLIDGGRFVLSLGKEEGFYPNISLPEALLLFFLPIIPDGWNPSPQM